MAAPSKSKGKARQQVLTDYEAFINKFKPRHTTDECYTPEYIYTALLGWLQDEGHITPATPIIRPFYPEGDYTRLDQYTPGAIVVDNPPFSIITPITRFYLQHNIPFFLFCPSLTSFAIAKNNPDATIIIVNLQIIYDNGAIVNTAFVTNLPAFQPYAAITAPDLYNRLDQAQRTARAEVREKKALPRYQYPANLVTATILHRIACTIPFQIPRAQSHPISSLAAQRPLHKVIFGSGLLIPDTLAAQLQAAQLQAAPLPATQPSIVFPLSEDEKAIIKDLEK